MTTRAAVEAAVEHRKLASNPDESRSYHVLSGANRALLTSWRTCLRAEGGGGEGQTLSSKRKT